MIFWLILDLFFYTYTTFPTCFFLIYFFNRHISFFEILFTGLLWDIFVIHTMGIFSLILLIFYYIRKIYKGAFTDSGHFLLLFLIILIIYSSINLLIFKEELPIICLLIDFIYVWLSVIYKRIII